MSFDIGDYVPPREATDFNPSHELALDLGASWRKEALCKELITEQGILINAWIDEKDPNADYAKAACGECKVRTLCLQSAAADTAAYGVRGGYFFNNGALLTADVNRVFKEERLIIRSRQKQRVYKTPPE